MKKGVQSDCVKRTEGLPNKRPDLFGAFVFVRSTNEKDLSAHQRHILAGSKHTNRIT